MAEINLVVIKTDKLQEQSEFYSRLGFKFEYHKHGNGPYHYASFGSGAVLEIYPLPKGVTEPDNTTRLGFSVKNLDVLIKDLESHGIRIVTAPVKMEWGYSAVVQDCDGRKIELTEN